jgi:hypothetical protein
VPLRALATQRGGIEYGFSSTTTDKDQALLFAQGRESTIFEMQMGMVDRGADLTWLSQYPHEQEVLLPPLTGIEALNLEVDGTMLVIHSRLSLNLASHTLEQVRFTNKTLSAVSTAFFEPAPAALHCVLYCILPQVLSRRRKMLMDMVSGIELELRDALGNDKFTFGMGVLRRALAYGPFTRDPEWFNDDENVSPRARIQSARARSDPASLCLMGAKLRRPPVPPL